MYNSRPTREYTQIWRRRRCLSCKKTFSTYERIDMQYLKIIKEMNRHETYSRTRLYNSITSVMNGDKQKLDQLDALVDTIESKLIRLGQASIYISQLSQAVNSTLARYDLSLWLAYIGQQTKIQSKSDLKKLLSNL